METTMLLARNLSASAQSLGSERAGPLNALAHAWSTYRDGAARRNEAHATIEALAGLDDAALADIGLHRSQILSIANGEFQRPLR
jgi:uncharacterized protein YjiS (DUF1127 family)